MTGSPPYAITPDVLSRVERIGEAIGRVEASGVLRDLRLRRLARVRAVRGSLAIEGNVLSEAQVATILDGEPVTAPPRDVQEARNAIRAYERCPEWDPAREPDLLRAHEILMTGLLDAPGRYRRTGVRVIGGGRVHHVGPPAARVPQLMAGLLAWLGETGEHPLIAGAVFHYEFEFIHPFEDGNGRMGRLWQTLILSRWRPLFAYVPVESLIQARQSDYYDAIRRSSAAGESTPFVTFILDVILEALRTPAPTDQEGDQVSDQVARLLNALRAGPRSASALMADLRLSHRPTFRRNYLHPAMAAGLVEMTRPASPSAKNQKYRLAGRPPRARGGRGSGRR